MPIGLNEGNIGRSVCPGFGKSTYGASLAKTSETVLETVGRTFLEDENMSGRSLIATDEEVCNKLPDIVYCLRSDRKDTVLFIR